jgi:hypothetical protein
MSNLLQVKAINGVVSRVYAEGDQWDVESRIPEVGSNASFEDGRSYVFCSTDANFVAGESVGSVAASAELLAVWSDGKEEGDNDIGPAVGDTGMSFVLASVTEDQYANGYITVTLGTGAGYTYRIKSNTASVSVDYGTSGTPEVVANVVTLVLCEEICVALAITDNIIIKTSRVSNVIEGTASLDPVGVAVSATTAATTGITEFFWAQTTGVAMVLGTIGAVNVDLTPAAAGALGAADGTDIVVATGLAAGASNSQACLCYPKA